MGDGGSLRIANVNVFDAVAGRVQGPFDVTIGQGTITSVGPVGPVGPAGPARPEESGGGRRSPAGAGSTARARR
jgi:hypothetical protein